MNIVYSLSEFLVTEWVWSVTFGWHHAFINMLVMVMLFILVAKRGMIQSVLLAFSSQLFAVTSFLLCAHVILGYLFGISFGPEMQPTLIHPLATSFLLGMIYAGFQTLFFRLLHVWMRLPVQKLGVLAMISNTIAALIIYKFLPPL